MCRCFGKIEATSSSEDGIVVAIGVLVLLIGTATGSAFAMLAMALVALAVTGIFYRHRLGRNGLQIETIATITQKLADGRVRIEHSSHVN